MSSEVKLRPMKMGKAAKTTTATSEAAPTMATLSHAKTCEKRNSHLHNICIHMLCQGHHRAYTQLFNLVDRRRREREEQGPGGELSLEPRLESEVAYLDKMNEHLCQAEEHERAKQYKEQYTHIHQLANYFRHEKLTWVSDHFYTEALNIAVNVAFDSGKCVCEANERCALAAEVNDDLEAAHNHLVESRKASRGRTNWRHAESDLTWHQENSRHLTRVLIKMSSIVDSETQKRLLNEACKAATDSKLNLSIAEAHFSYGASGANSFVENQDALQKALQAACQITNHELIQKITKALAALWKTHRAGSTTQMGRSVEFLQLAVEKTADNPEASIAALSEMALLYNAACQYPAAVEAIDRAYATLDAMPRAELGGWSRQECATRVAAGAITANRGMAAYRRQLAASKDDAEALKAILKWKTCAE